MGNKRTTRMLTLSALMTAIMLVLGYIESLIPVSPIQGIKLGLSNSVLMLALYWMGVPAAFMLMTVKVALSGLLFAGFSAMMYSFAGGLASMIAMSLVYRIKGVTPVGVGALGAVMHNAGQVGLAMIVLKNTRLMGFMAVLILAGLATGVVTGLIAKLLMKRIPGKLYQDCVKR